MFSFVCFYNFVKGESSFIYFSEAYFSTTHVCVSLVLSIVRGLQAALLLVCTPRRPDGGSVPNVSMISGVRGRQRGESHAGSGSFRLAVTPVLFVHVTLAKAKMWACHSTLAGGEEGGASVRSPVPGRQLCVPALLDHSKLSSKAVVPAPRPAAVWTDGTSSPELGSPGVTVIPVGIQIVRRTTRWKFSS